MVSAFDRAYDLTEDMEDAPGTADDVVNDPDDRGGLTYKGLTQGTYNGWRAKHKLLPRPVTQSTAGERRQLALEEFWLACKCDQLPEPLAMAVFDMAYHSKAVDARKTLQRALLVKVDGDIGPKTIAAARAAGPIGVLRFLKARGAVMQDIWIRDHSQLKYAEGWIARLLDQLYAVGLP